jgi:hypothetical protein
MDNRQLADLRVGDTARRAGQSATKQYRDVTSQSVDSFEMLVHVSGKGRVYLLGVGSRRVIWLCVRFLP